MCRWARFSIYLSILTYYNNLASRFSMKKMLAEAEGGGLLHLQGRRKGFQPAVLSKALVAQA